MSSYIFITALLLCWYLNVIHSQSSVEPQRLEWTWIGGSKSTYDAGVYGEKGVPSPFNYPGARYETLGWYDSVRQEYWLFGGHGRDGFSGFGMFVISITSNTKLVFIH